MPKDLNIENPLDNHLKPVKDSDGTDSALEISTEDVRVKNLKVSGTTTGISISDDTKLPLAGGTMTGDIAMSDASITNVKELTLAAGEDGLSLDGGSLYIMSFKDEDNMASNDHTAICSQQSIKAYVDANAGGGGTDSIAIHHGARGRTQYNNWYGPNNAYGVGYYYWTQSTNSTSLPTSWLDSSNPMHIVSLAGNIVSYSIVGNISTTDTYEFALLKGTGVTFGSAGNWTVSQVGATQSAGGTSNILYKWEQTGLSVSVAKNDCLLLMFRRTTDNDNSYSYIEFAYNIVIEPS